MKRLIAILILSCSAWAATNTVGQVGVTASGVASGADLFRCGSFFTPSIDSTVNSISWVGANSGTSTAFNVAIYKLDDTGGKPGTLVCQGTPQPVTAASPITFDMTSAGCGTLPANTNYCIASNYHTTVNMYAITGVPNLPQYYFTAGTKVCCTFANVSGANTSTTEKQSLWANVTPLTGQQCGSGVIDLTNVLSPTFTATKNVVWASPCVPAANSTVARCRTYTAYYSSTPGNINCAVYSDSGGPANVICQGTAQTVANGDWQTIPISGCGTLNAGTTYWVAVNHDTDTQSMVQFANVGTGGYNKAQTYGTFTNIASPTAGTKVAAYLDLTANPSGGGQAHIF